MILIISAEDDTHVPVVTRQLDVLGAKYIWFNPAHFPTESEVRVAYNESGLVRQLLCDRGRDVDLAAVTAVWDRRPGSPTAAAEVEGEAQRKWISEESAYCLAGIWGNMDCLWVPGKPRDVIAGQNKIKLLAMAAALGFRIPRTLVTNSPDAFLQFYSECSGRLITKVLRDGLVTRDNETYMAYTHLVRRRDTSNYRAVRYVPLMIQEYVTKQLELRITVVGSKVFAAAINSQASRLTRHDWRHYDNDRATYAQHTLPSAIETLCVRLVQNLHLTFGAIDMVLTPAGEYVFLEINPSGQWSWIETLTGLPIGTAIAELLASRTGAITEGRSRGINI